jgi:hypothetical protein
MADIIARTIQQAQSRNIQSEIVSQNSEVKVSVSRPPSTANLFIDSINRVDGASSTQFSITKSTNILTGYFTRLAVVEIVLDWCIPNVSPYNQSNTLTFTIGGTPYTITLPTGHYTTAQVLDTMVVLMNEEYGNDFEIVENTNTGRITIEGTDEFAFDDTGLITLLGLVNPSILSTSFLVQCPKIVPNPFVDFVCPQLTYPQDVKDGSTALLDNNVIYRWYLAWEGQPSVDKYNFPIFQGYTPFYTRRYLPFPKQVKWDSNLPIGQLSFQVLDDKGIVIPTFESEIPSVGELEFQMTLLVSEN